MTSILLGFTLNVSITDNSGKFNNKHANTLDISYFIVVFLNNDNEKLRLYSDTYKYGETNYFFPSILPSLSFF